ncbi:hypothetical protein [Borrelia sp. RT1S]|uniref:hypothetical protein n=1 Tax=Borrelia sp. RT1S TaxID=2898580 RepID=UPI0027149E4C|nr:hypothetical protein [Borrelia sp. RT1S]UGQ17628.2 hypothetical protein LSO05_04465 [Borrelia sp. RT1S]
MAENKISFKNSVLFNKDILSKLGEISQFAPLHNPAAILVMEATLKIFPNIRQVLCFNTSWC